MSKDAGKDAAAGKESKAPEVGEMKKGDYCIHVYVQEGKQFKSEKGDLSTPMIQITCGGKSKYTSSKNDVTKNSTVYWGEHLFFERGNVSKNEIESSQISIRVLNKGLFKDDLIGAYDFDVTFVYFQEKHTLFNTWIAFSNPEGKDFNEITCYLKLGISITGPGDDQVALNDETGPHGAEEQEVMMPASIRKQYKQLKIKFVKGEQFPKMDIGGTIDAYIQTTYFKKKINTEAVTQTRNTAETAIEQEFWLPVQWPLATDRLVLKVYDKDPVKDEIVGSMFFSLKQLIGAAEANGEQGIMKWYNLYGSPLGVSGDNTDKMNNYPEFASTWKGRILIHITCADVKNPEMKVEKLTQEYKTQIMKSGALDYTEFELIAEVGGGISLPGKKKYTVRIQINEFKVESKKAIEQKGNYNRWSERFEAVTFKGPYKSVEELGNVYIYLMDGDDAICYWKGKASEFEDQNPKFRWLPMTADLAKGKVTNSWEAGLVQVKLSLNHKSKNGPVDWKKIEAWKKPPPKRLSSWKIRVFIFQCKDIPSADSDGASDPYISIWNPDDKKILTQVVEDNINPIFFEALELYYDFEQIQNAPPVVLNIWDKDELLDGDDYLGRCVVYLNEASLSNDDTIPEPKWHDIRIGFLESDPPCGQMLVSFSVVEDDFTFKIPISYLKLTEEIEYKEYNVEINVLGLRNMESFGLMPVKKPFIKFNLRSLLPPEKAQAVTNIKTQPSATGSNPNINTVINFTIDLPVNPLFCPKLQCDVYDYVYKGLVQPLLGTFSLSIGELMHQAKREREDQMHQSDKIIATLKRRLQQIENESLFVMDGNEISFDQRVSGLNRIADQNLDDTALLTEHSSTKDKQKLLEGPGSAKQDEEGLMFKMIDKKGDKEEESKTLLDKDKEKVVPEEEESKTPDLEKSKSQSKTPLSDLSASRMQKKQTLAKNLFKTGDSKLQTDIETGLNLKLMIEKQVQKETEKQRIAQEREDAKKEMKEKGMEFHKNILYPSYKFDDRIKMSREVLPKPPSTLYYEVGFDKQAPEKPEDGNKHYRRYYEDELENVKEIFKRFPFHTSDVIRGQSRGLSKGFFSWGFLAKKTDESGQVTNQKVVGKFKGRLNIENQEEKEHFKVAKETKVSVILTQLNEIHNRKFGRPLDFKIADLESFEKAIKFEHLLEQMGCDQVTIMNFLKEQSYQEMISRMLVVKTKCIVRLYMLEGYEFAQKDIGSFSDPYLKIKCGTKKFNERDNYQLDEPNPKFHKMYEMDAEFPGAPPIVIKAFDYDDLFGDDLIGTTTIDLDDRFFCPEWQQIEDKPVEYRSLYHPSSQIPQGTITCWLEIHPTTVSTKGTAKVYDLAPQPLLDYQVRLVIYDTKDVPCEDVEGTSDVFIKAFIDDNDKKESDCHYRCKDGKASFNYRLLFNLKAPRKNNNLTLQVWDRDLFKSNDFISEIQFPLQKVFEDAVITQKPISLTKKYWDSYLSTEFKGKHDDLKIKFHDEDSFYIETKGKEEGKSGGLLRIGINITPGEMATKNPVGSGRSEPNHSPFLPPPVGRISFSLNPFTMLAQLVGPEVLRKIYGYCCLIVCAALCIVMIPMVSSNLMSQAIMSIF